MLKKTITYTDFEGIERSEDFYFNLTKAEVTEMEMSVNGGMTKILNRMISEKDGKKMIELFKDLILRSYGEKSTDGKRFMKNKELRDAFVENQAYSELFMELSTDADAAAKFVNGILPLPKEIKPDVAKGLPTAFTG